MIKLLAILLAASLGLALLAGPAAAQSTFDESRQITVADYTVFVDPPTGFVFVKLPQGWKFAGKVEPFDVAHLPSNVVTALLIPETDIAEADAGVGKVGKLQQVD